jgi:hypothetical protein
MITGVYLGEEPIGKTGQFAETETFSIPGDYDNLQDAINALAAKYHKKNTLITLELQTGHTPLSGIVIEDMDCGNFIITAQADAEITVHNDFTGDFIHGKNSNLPMLAAVINMNDMGDNGYHCENNSKGIVMPNYGVKNAGATGLLVTGNSNCNGPYSVFTGANDCNVKVIASSVDLQYSVLSGSKGGEANVYGLQGAIVYINDCDCDNANADGVICEAAWFSFDLGTANNCGRYGVYVTKAGQFNARDCEAKDNTGFGAYVEQVSRAMLRNAFVKDNGTGIDISCNTGSTIIANGCTTTNGTPNIGNVNLTAFNTLEAGGIVWN